MSQVGQLLDDPEDAEDTNDSKQLPGMTVAWVSPGESVAHRLHWPCGLQTLSTGIIERRLW